tara:strand:+ start:803 stop:1435 length:633 start_codon:yes stop_codon:yes gene_type:complete
MGYYIGSRALPMDRPWTADNGTQYPANWLRLSSTADRDAIGVSWGANDPVYDQRFYWSPTLAKQLDDKTETVDGSEVTTTGLKTLWKSNQNDIAGSLIAPSDWRIIKAKETSTNIPSAWKTYRAAVRTSCNTRQTEIDACKTVDELKELLFGLATIAKTKEQQQTDSDGNGVVDSDDNPVMETVDDLDSDGNIQMIANPAIATAWPAEPS